MNKYHTFPNCMDVIINDSDVSEHLSTEVLHHRVSISFSSASVYANDLPRISVGFCHSFQYSKFPIPSWWPVDESHMYAFAEAASSPAKYSSFQLLGYKALQKFGYLGTASISSLSSACVGAVGGTVLALLYFALLLARKDQIRTESAAILSFSSYALLLSKEMTYSAIAAIIGAWAKGLYSSHTVWSHVVAGILGPILFLFLLFGGLGFGLSFVCIIEKFRDWYSGY